MNNLTRGALIVLCAAFIAGVGNAITGLTAHEYQISGSLLPAIDIALANTLGGVFFLLVVYFLRKITSKNDKSSVKVSKARLFIPGAFKGINTCLFVFSTTYIAATRSFIFEGTYIIWTLVLSYLFLRQKVPLVSTSIKTILVCIGIFFISSTAVVQKNSQGEVLGTIFGTSAGLSYALFILFWSVVTEKLTNLNSQLKFTIYLLTVSLLTISTVTELVSVILTQKWWLPFSHLKYRDVFLQVINGGFVMGIVYLLLTVGMHKLKNAREGASYIAAFCLSFAIPFTLLPELIIKKFLPTSEQYAGIVIFMVGFVLMSITLSKRKENSV